MKDEKFIDVHKKSIEFGFWDETYRASVIYQLERAYHSDVLREWYISDMVINGSKVLLKWNKRLIPLSDEELKSKFGR